METPEARSRAAGAGGAAPPPLLGRAEAEEFLYREARLLDERRFEEWLGLWTGGGRYLVPGGPGDDPGEEAAIVDDDRATLADRIARLRSPAAYAQSPPSRTVRVVSNVEVAAPGAGPSADVHSSLVIFESRLGQTRVVAARCLHRLVAEAVPAGAAGPASPAAGGGLWRIGLKRVRLVDWDRPQGNLTFLL